MSFDTSIQKARCQVSIIDNGNVVVANTYIYPPFSRNVLIDMKENSNRWEIVREALNKVEKVAAKDETPPAETVPKKRGRKKSKVGA